MILLSSEQIKAFQSHCLSEFFYRIQFLRRRKAHTQHRKMYSYTAVGSINMTWHVRLCQTELWE